MEKMIITDGTGFLNKALAEKFKDRFQVFLCGRNVMLGQAAQAKTSCSFIPLDICSKSSVDRVFADLSPSIVVHAAASKFVDTDELFPAYCCETNIQGSINVIDAAKLFKVKRIVAISTDKAASPSNSIYGASKLVMEHLFEKSFRSNSTVESVTVRLGNIAWSSGSVLPIWEEMIKTSGVIRTTGYGMRRFMTSAQDVSAFVDLALENASEYRSQVLIPRMGWVRISRLLDRFLSFYRGTFEVVPPREGEAVSESLLSPAEISYTRNAELGSRPVYVLSHGSRSAEILETNRVCDIESYEELQDEEIDRLILNAR